MSAAPSCAARKRLVFVALAVFFLFCALIVQFFKIQIVEGEKWARQGKLQHQMVVVEPFKRGLFYSNTALKSGHPEMPQAFVADVPKFHLFADPKSLPKEYRDEVAKQLQKFLALEESEGSKLRIQFDKQSRSRKLAMWMSKEVRDVIANWWFSYARQKKIPRNALFFVQDYKRSYPFGKLLGQVLHTVREEKEARSNQSVPTGGLELIFNQVLQGKEGKRQLLRSPRHPLETGKILALPEDGADVYLTINHYLQAVAEEEIEKAVKAANAKQGWAILMHPRTGEIFAMAQYPGFEPEHYRKYFNDPQLKPHTGNPALTDPFEPGSTMKPLTVAIALKANQELIARGKKPLFSPQEKIPSRNGVFPGRRKPISDVGSHGFLNMAMALQKSSNIYMARLIQRVIEQLGDQWYRNALTEIFGFGKKTGIELPSESPGLVPTPGKVHPNGALEWSVPTPFSLAFGHNLLVNSLQLMRSWGILANGGYDVRPTLVRKVIRKKRDGSEEILLDNTVAERVQAFPRVLDKQIVDEVVDALKYVTKPGGAAARGDIFGYTEAGKSGTSEKIVNGAYSKRNHISTFIGFAPAKKPEFVLLIAIDEPEFKYTPGLGSNQFGGKCAAPAFQEIGQRTLQYLGVEPDDPFGYPPGDPRRNEEKADWIQETKRLRELYQQWNG